MIIKIFGIPIITVLFTLFMPISSDVKSFGWIIVIFTCLIGVAGVLNIDELEKDE